LLTSSSTASTSASSASTATTTAAAAAVGTVMLTMGRMMTTARGWTRRVNYNIMFSCCCHRETNETCGYRQGVKEPSCAR
jgi:uncharacterized membrane protein